MPRYSNGHPEIRQSYDFQLLTNKREVSFKVKRRQFRVEFRADAWPVVGFICLKTFTYVWRSTGTLLVTNEKTRGSTTSIQVCPLQFEPLGYINKVGFRGRVRV